LHAIPKCRQAYQEAQLFEYSSFIFLFDTILFDIKKKKMGDAKLFLFFFSFFFLFYFSNSDHHHRLGHL